MIISFDSVGTNNIKLLRGADHSELHLYTEPTSRKYNGTVTISAKLDWALFEEYLKTEKCMPNKHTLHSVTDHIIQKFWDTESYVIVHQDEITVVITKDMDMDQVKWASVSYCYIVER